MPKKKKTITCTRQYLRGSAICLRPRSCRDFTIIREKKKKKEYKVRLHFFLYHSRMQQQQPQNHATLFGSGWVVNRIKHKLGSTKPNKSPTWRLVQSPTSAAILQKQTLILATHPPVLKLEDQLKLHTASASQ